MSSIAVLIPCYNEATTIGKVIGEYRAALPEATIYVYDNNSTDGSETIAKNAGAFVRRETRQGKGYVLRAMFRDIDADCYIVTDGDDTYPPSKAREMARLVIEEGADMVVGDRLGSTYFTENKRIFHNGGNILVRGLLSVLFHSDVPDVMTGSRAFSALFVKTFPIRSRGFEIETEMTIHALDKQLSVRSIVVEYRDRPSGSHSKLRTIPDGIRVLRTILRLLKNYRPLLLFGVMGVFCLLLSAVLFWPIFSQYLKTGLVPRFPTLIVATMFAVVGVQCLFTGLILDNLVQMERRQFENTVNSFAIQNRWHRRSNDYANEE